MKAVLPCDVARAAGAWVCDAPQVVSKTGRSVLIWASEARSAHPKLQLCAPDEPLCVLGERGDFLMLELRGDAQRQCLQQLDAFAMARAHANCSAWFGKALSQENIRCMYQPLLENSALRVRLAENCNVWSAQGAHYSRASKAELAQGTPLLPCLSVRGIYFKSRSMGLSVECSDLLLYPSVHFPFHVQLSERAERAERALPEHDEE
jgi:hypothetical protein